MNSKFFNALRSESFALLFWFGAFVLTGVICLLSGFIVIEVAALAPILALLVLFCVAFMTRNWGLAYEAERYLQRRRSNAPRNNWLRWLSVVPSLFGVFALLFFPIASHVIAPFSGYFAQHRIPVPWSVLVSKTSWGPNWEEIVCLVPRTSFGMTPRGSLESAFRTRMAFGTSYRPDRPFDLVVDRKNGRLFDIGSGHLLHCAEPQTYLSDVAVYCYAAPNALRWEFSASFRATRRTCPCSTKCWRVPRAAKPQRRTA